nr:orf271 [Zancudomyces culisetae]AAW49503.1 orf271 [Zancudomyces culisetae]
YNNLFLFKSEFQKIKKSNAPDDKFLYWLIGFTEGDGCFSINHRKELSFILIQGIDNIELLKTIQTTLNMGNLIKQGPRVYRLIIQKREDLRLLILLFNGNLILPSRKVQFNLFLLNFNSKSLKKKDYTIIPYLLSNNLPSLNNTWLLGFTEAEGCFTISLLNNSKAFRTRYILSQKGDINLPILSYLILLFKGGKVEGHSKKDNYSYIISGLDNVQFIYPYFDKYVFMGIKGLSYLAFKQLNERIKNGEHLNLEKRKELVILSHNINRKSK